VKDIILAVSHVVVACVFMICLTTLFEFIQPFYLFHWMLCNVESTCHLKTKSMHSHAYPIRVDD